MTERVLVAGGAGFLGSHLIDRLLNDGHSVVCVDDFSTGREQNLAHHSMDERLVVIHHDVTNPLDDEAWLTGASGSGSERQIDRIFNLACPASPIQYQHDPVRTIKTNVLGSINLLDLANRLQVPILQASTSEVYGDPLEHPQTEAYWGRVNPIGERSCYDEGKRAAETLFFDFHRMYGLSIKVMRIFNTYGPRMDSSDGRVVSNFISQALRGDDITIYGEGSQTRSFCYVDDLIEGMIRLMGSPREITGPVNVGNPDELTMLELAQRILAQTGSSSKVKFEPLPADDPSQRQPDISLARMTLGWEPQVHLADGLERTIEYFRSHIKTR